MFHEVCLAQDDAHCVEPALSAIVRPKIENHAAEPEW